MNTYLKMKINLKDLSKQKEELKYMQEVMYDHSVTKQMARKLKKVIDLYEEIETDLLLSGESIVELDMPRLEAIEERNKFYNFFNKMDDV